LFFSLALSRERVGDRVWIPNPLALRAFPLEKGDLEGFNCFYSV